MGAAVPKQFLQLAGKPVLMHTMELFADTLPDLNMVLVLSENQMQYWEDLCRTLAFHLPHHVVAGGAERFHSVLQGLNAITDTEGVVGVHDAVRPLVNKVVIERCYATALQMGNAVPMIGLSDCLREMVAGVSHVVDRSKYCLVQTPQCFLLNQLREAYGQPFEPHFTDDAAVAEAAGYAIHLVEGNEENIKLTHPAHFRLAEALWQR